MKYLTRAEEMFLLAIWRLKDNAYGLTIRKQIKESSHIDYSYGTLYGILDQLTHKEYIDRIKGDPTPKRGGRSKIYYKITPRGIEALKKAMEIHKNVWQGITEFSFNRV